jgi:hypothetical protein
VPSFPGRAFPAGGAAAVPPARDAVKADFILLAGCDETHVPCERFAAANT